MPIKQKTWGIILSMNKKLSPYFIDLTQDACLKAFWRKDSLRKFLAQHGISQNFLASWSPEEIKAAFLRRLFSALITRKDLVGHKVIFKISQSLVEMKSFTDLSGWPDSDEKIQNAYRAVEKLRIEYDKVNNKIEEEKQKSIAQKKATENREKIIYSCQSLEKFQNQLVDLLKMVGTQRAGYDFENWFYEFAVFHDIPASKPYKDKNGRQIDGSVTIDGTTFLVETKFTQQPISSQEIDIFESKVRRKADNTMGLLVSISGFTSEAIKAASCDRTLLILIDGNHFFNLIFTQKMSFKESIQNSLIHASRTGISYLPVGDFQEPLP